MSSQVHVLLQVGHVDLMHMGQVGGGGGVDAVFLHQPGQGGAVFRPVMAAQPVGLGFGHTEGFRYPGGHAHLDLVEKPRFGRVKRIVKVEDPGRDMRECIGNHGRKLGLRRRFCNGPRLMFRHKGA